MGAATSMASRGSGHPTNRPTTEKSTTTSTSPFEFPGAHYDAETNPDDICIVTYSSISTNRSEPYGETVFGSRGTLMMKTEKEATALEGGERVLRWRAGPAFVGGQRQRRRRSRARRLRNHRADRRGRHQLDRQGEPRLQGRTGTFLPLHSGRTTSRVRRREGLRCNGEVAMADAIMALTANLAMKHKKRIAFKPEWFDPDNPAVP